MVKNDGRLAGKVAIVTGGDSDMGVATVGNANPFTFVSPARRNGLCCAYLADKEAWRLTR